MIAKEKKQAIMAEYARTEGDTGSPEVQIAVLTARINELTEHFKANPKYINREIRIKEIVKSFIQTTTQQCKGAGEYRLFLFLVASWGYPFS